jgi:hypothetical protein
MRLLTANGWILSKKADLGILWGTLLLSLIAFIMFDISKYSTWNWFQLFLLTVLIDSGHIFATICPVLIRKIDGVITQKYIYLVILSVCVCSGVLFLYSKQLFSTIVAYVAIFHIYSQQYGLVMVSRIKAKEPSNTRTIDTIIIWNIMLFPFIWWMSPGSTIAKHYFSKNDFIFFVSQHVADIFHYIHWGLNLLYILFILLEYLRAKKINFAKLSFMFATWGWLYFGIVIFQNGLFFWTCLMAIHGIFYIIYTYKTFSRSIFVPPLKRRGLVNVLLKKKFYILFIYILSAVWLISDDYIYKMQPTVTLLMIISWWPLLLHYTFDSLIWKRKRTLKLI